MPTHSSVPTPHDSRTWILVAVVIAVLGLMAVFWDSRDLGDGLVLGSGGSVSAVWDSARGGLDDFLFGSPSTPRR